MRKKINLKRNTKGFTLIELLIVIIIIGILAAIAFVAYSGSQNRAKKADAEATLSQVKSKLGEYNADNSSYPATIGDLGNWIASSAGGNNDTLGSKFTAANDYGYSVTPADCGDTVAASGTITEGTSACSGFTLTAEGTIFGGGSPADDITVNN
jgi:type IV pilus assembly protein PilE